MRNYMAMLMAWFVIAIVVGVMCGEYVGNTIVRNTFLAIEVACNVHVFKKLFNMVIS